MTMSGFGNLTSSQRFASSSGSVVLNKIPTKENLQKRKILSDSMCDSCFTVEDTRHILLDCPRSTHMWCNLGFNPQPFNDSSDISSWFKANLKKNSAINGIPSCLIFLFGCHSLWRWRNLRLFEPGKPFSPITIIMSLASEFLSIGPQKYGVKTQQSVVISWAPPPPGHFKLNSDGAVNGDTCIAGAGGLFRDHNGVCILGYARKIRTNSSLEAELWGLRDGLKIVVDMRYLPVIVEIDASSIIHLLDMDSTNHPLNSLLIDCRCLLSRLHVGVIRHVLREGNKAADALANLGCNLSFQLTRFLLPPTGVDLCILNDANGVGSIRRCNLNSSF